MMLRKSYRLAKILLLVSWVALGYAMDGIAQRFVRPLPTIDALIASNPNDPHTNVFIPQGPTGPGLFYQWRKDDTGATNADQSVLDSTWPGASGKWYNIPLKDTFGIGGGGISNAGTNGLAVVNTLADLRNVPGNLGIGMVYVRGHSVPYDWGEGFFSRANDCLTADDSGRSSVHGNDGLTCWIREVNLPWTGTPVQQGGGTVTRQIINDYSLYKSTRGGGWLYITDGDWPIDTSNGPILGYSNVSIIGSSSARLVGDGSGDMFSWTNVQNAAVVQLGITNCANAFVLRGCTNVLIAGNAIATMSADGIRQYGGDNVRVEANNFVGMVNGIRQSLDGAVKVTRPVYLNNTFGTISGLEVLTDSGACDGFQRWDSNPEFRLTQLLSSLWMGTNAVLRVGTGTPEGSVPADPSSLFLRRDTGEVYRKLSGTGNTGWGQVGDVSGPASATDNALARFDGATGKLLQNSSATLTDAGAILAGNGTAANPTYSFASAPSTGVKLGTSGSVDSAAGGTTVQSVYGGSIAWLANSGIGWTTGDPSTTGFNAGWVHEGTGIIGQRKPIVATGPTAQQYRIYANWTNSTDYSRMALKTTTTEGIITPEQQGSSAAITLKFVYDAVNNVFDSSGAGSPEGVLPAGVGSTYRRTDGGASTSFYIKESGTGNTGWVAK